MKFTTSIRLSWFTVVSRSYVLFSPLLWIWAWKSFILAYFNATFQISKHVTSASVKDPQRLQETYCILKGMSHFGRADFNHYFLLLSCNGQGVGVGVKMRHGLGSIRPWRPQSSPNSRTHTHTMSITYWLHEKNSYIKVSLMLFVVSTFYFSLRGANCSCRHKVSQ